MSACPLCGCTSTEEIYLAHTTVHSCESQSCSLQFADPQPTDEALRLAYSKFYYPGKEKDRGVRFENTPVETLRQMFRALEARIGSLNGLRLLDYGCGRGPLLRVALEFGINATGIELDPEARAVAARIPGASVYAAVEGLRLSEPEARFDLIVLWTVIEHLRRPWDDLASLRTILRPGGWLFVSTMDIRCLRARLERGRWENYENPTHLYYFDRRSLAQAIRKAGFTDFVEWRLKFRHKNHGFLRRAFYSLSFSLGLADGLFYLCKGTEGGPSVSADVTLPALAHATVQRAAELRPQQRSSLPANSES